MRRHIRTFGHVTEVAQITLIDHLPVVLLFYPVDFQGGGGVHQIEQCGEGIAEIDTAPAAVADVENALQLIV